MPFYGHGFSRVITFDFLYYKKLYILNDQIKGFYKKTFNLLINVIYNTRLRFIYLYIFIFKNLLNR